MIPLTPFILERLKPFQRVIFVQFAIATLWGIDLSLRPYLLKVMVNRVDTLQNSDAVSGLIGPASLYIALSLFVVLAFRIYDYIWLQMNPALRKQIADYLMNKMMEHSQMLFSNNFSGALATKIKDVMMGVPDLLKLIVNNFYSNLFALLIAIFALWTVHLNFAIMLTLWVVIFVSGSILFSKQAKILSDKAADVRSGVIGKMVDILSNMMSVRLFSATQFESSKLNKSLEDSVHADRERDWYLLKLFAFQGLSFVFYQAACLIWLIKGFKEGSVTAGDFAMILTINISIVSALWEISEDISKGAEFVGNISQGLNVALTPIDIEDKKGAKELFVKKGQIIFNDVTFTYKGGHTLFENLSVVIKPQEKVGLVGFSGSGKSTFVNLILRLYDVNQGKILIDEQNIADVTQSSLHKAISIIPQDPSLFHRSLRDNICYGDVMATDDQMIEAAKKAHVHNFITKLPEGYETAAGEKGVKISGGQRQRITIARAFLKNAPILILDEATSALDSVTESDIQDSLWELMEGKTTIVIAHRLSTLLYMDRILVFDKGKIIEDSTHKELIEKEGLYKTLWEAQTENLN